MQHRLTISHHDSRSALRFDHQSGAALEVDGARIYYEEKGDRQNPPLVLLHGGFGNIEDFNGILPDLQGEFRIVGIDSRGQGMSTSPK